MPGELQGWSQGYETVRGTTKPMVGLRLEDRKREKQGQLKEGAVSASTISVAGAGN